MPKLIVCLTGMPGAGKSTIARGLSEAGYRVVNMGDAVRAEAARRGLEPTGPNLGELMLELRRKGGPGAVADLVAPEIRASDSEAVVVDGIRSDSEIDVLRGVSAVKLLLVHASTDTRFGFLSLRGRPDDPDTRESFEARDAREMGVGISEPIALADESISNNELTREQLVERAVRIVRGWLA